ncbi:MAG: hypothetical protein HY293_01425 [Planctomycetes bacterium]|nr:hypothetical protein [Planctomycetota bacterium]
MIESTAWWLLIASPLSLKWKQAQARKAFASTSSGKSFTIVSSALIEARARLSPEAFLYHSVWKLIQSRSRGLALSLSFSARARNSFARFSLFTLAIAMPQ